MTEAEWLTQVLAIVNPAARSLEQLSEAVEAGEGPGADSVEYDTQRVYERIDEVVELLAEFRNLVAGALAKLT